VTPSVPYRYPVDVPVLTDGVVTLRAHTDADIEPMVQMCRDEQMQHWTQIGADYGPGDAERWVRVIMRTGWEERDHRGWAIEATGDDGTARFAGNVDVRGAPVADIGFSLHPWARGRGLMVRAVRLAAQWAFTEGGVEIVHWRAHVGNTTSLRVAWACGFELHGRTRGLLYEKDRVIDAWTGSLTFGDEGSPRTTWWDVPVLEGERVRLRPWRAEDAPRIAEALADGTTRHWMSFLPAPYTVATAREYVLARLWQAATGAAVGWCVADRRTDEVLGNVAILHMDQLDPSAGEVGYWVRPDARGEGIMTEAAGLAIAHALRPGAAGGLGRRRLELLAAASNAPSNALARRLGFVQVGLARRAEPLADGTYDDLVCYDLLA